MGYLQKKTKKLAGIRTWTKGWFILTPNSLHWFKSEQTSQFGLPLGFIHFDQLDESKGVVVHDKKLTIHTVPGVEMIELKGKTEREAQEWAAAINRYLAAFAAANQARLSGGSDEDIVSTLQAAGVETGSLANALDNQTAQMYARRRTDFLATKMPTLVDRASARPITQHDYSWYLVFTTFMTSLLPSGESNAAHHTSIFCHHRLLDTLKDMFIVGLNDVLGKSKSLDQKRIGTHIYLCMCVSLSYPRSLFLSTDFPLRDWGITQGFIERVLRPAISECPATGIFM